MPKKKIKKIIFASVSVLVGMLLLLCIHLYIVTRPKSPDINTRVMARIDFIDSLSASQSAIVTEWLYRQKGIDHALYNPISHILVFTFSPLHNDANRITSTMQQTFPDYKLARVMPSDAEMAAGCPVASNEISAKVLRFFRRL